MKSVYKGLLPLFIGMTLISCAGTDSPAQKKGEENQNMFKAGTPVADSLASGMQEFALSVFKKTTDSVPGEYYYHTTDGRIDTLFKKEGGKYKPVVSIAYDFLIGQDSYELKKGNHSYFVETGVLIAEEVFPKYSKAYWNNGKIKATATGRLYKDIQGNTTLDSGHLEIYSENGNVLEQSDWKNKNVVAGKEWNENGVLTWELDLPHYSKEYWDNGNPQKILTGSLYRDDQDDIQVDSGREEIYFENGKIKLQNEWKGKQFVAQKGWNENGILVTDMAFPQYVKTYWDNGKPKDTATGILYRDGQGNFALDSGHSESYFENGKIYQQNEWKDKQIVKQKEWNVNGVLAKESDFPKYFKEYWDNGKPKVALTGLLYRDDQGHFALDSGRWEVYFENGKIQQQNEWKDKLPVASKEWNEKGILTKDIDFPSHLKKYWNNGKPQEIFTGLLYREDNPCLFKPDSGHSDLFFENGKKKEQTDWMGKQPIAGKQWNEKGVLTQDLEFPKHFKEFWANGKPKGVMTGFLYRDDQGVIQVDSGREEVYFENGKIQQTNDWKDKLPVTQKKWNGKGVLTQDIDFPRHLKEYWDNGKPKKIATGILYKDNQGVIQVDSGRWEIYFENGKIQQQNDWINKQPVAGKEWNDKGVLTKELDFPKHIKEYWEKGKVKELGVGLLYRDDQGGYHLDSGSSEVYFENGKIHQQNNWKNKLLVAQKEWDENGILVKDIDFPKHFKKFWSNGNIKELGTGLLYRDDQGSIRVDSGHSEIYFENGKIHQQNDWKNKLLVIQKEWNESGVLTRELDFPKYFKGYWSNGNIKELGTGLLYIADQGNIALENGHTESYFENGKIYQQNDWKDKLPIASKEWNENGVLIKELDFPKYVKIYWNNGKPKTISTGTLYRDNRNNFSLESGHQEIYFENGKIKEKNDIKNKQITASKQWNESGALIVELDFPKYLKEYQDNGKPKSIMTGVLYRDSQGFFQLNSGHQEIYFENGKVLVQKDWKDKQVVTFKQWDENGALTKDIDFPKSFKEYWNNGKIKKTMTGRLYRDEQDIIQVDSGHSEIYFENGNIKEQNDWKDKQPVASKQWNENGSLIKELYFPESVKEYWDNGKIKQIAKGILYRGNHGNFKVDSGRSELYHENGRISQQNNWKNKQPIASKQWNEDGVLIKDLKLPQYSKEYWDNGNLKIESTGILYLDDQGSVKLDSGLQRKYFENGNIEGQKEWKDKQTIASKQWNEDGVLVQELDFPKSVKEYWDNGKAKQIATGTFYSVGPGDVRVDSGYSELYFENGNIKEQNNWKNKQPITSKQWHEDGTLAAELVFPKSFIIYWGNGKPNLILTGVLYRDDYGNFKLDSGHSEIYFENGIIKEQYDWKNKQPFTGKEWNINGILTKEVDSPKYYKEYWDNGKPKGVMKGSLYRDDQGVLQMGNGHSESYFENGKIKQQSDWKDKQLIAYKQWNENGTLYTEFDITAGYLKNYYENGITEYEINGFRGFTDNKSPLVETGHITWYYNNGKPKAQMQYQEKRIVGQKVWREDGTLSREGDASRGLHKRHFPNGKPYQEISGKFHYNDDGDIILENASEKWWNENGILTTEIVFPKYAKYYSENGNLSDELEGTLYYDEKHHIRLQDGFRKRYQDNGKLSSYQLYKGKELVGKTEWYENGAIKQEGDVSRGFHKEYFPNSTLSREVSGNFHYGIFSTILENASEKIWHENGKLAEQKKYKEGKLVGKTVRNENGIIVISVELPNWYKEFYDDGKIKATATGTIVEDDGSFRIQDGTYNEYDQNGEVTYSATYKDFQRISEK